MMVMVMVMVVVVNGSHLYHHLQQHHHHHHLHRHLSCRVSPIMSAIIFTIITIRPDAPQHHLLLIFCN